MTATNREKYTTPTPAARREGNQKSQSRAKPGGSGGDNRLAVLPARETHAQVSQASSQHKGCLTEAPPTGGLGLQSILQNAAAATNKETRVATLCSRNKGKQAQKQTVTRNSSRPGERSPEVPKLWVGRGRAGGGGGEQGGWGARERTIRGWGYSQMV